MQYMKNQTQYIQRFKKFLGTDRAILILSISIALIFWFFTKMTKSYKTNREVKIQYELPEGKLFLNHPTSTTKAEIKSDGWSLFYTYLKGGPPDLKIKLDTTKTQYISSTKIINKLSSKLGSNFQVININKDVFTIRLDNAEEKKVPIILNAKFNVENGFMLADSLQIFPDSFKIIGPASLIQSINNYPTENIEFNKLSNNFSKQIKPKTPSHHQLKIVPKEITISSKIERYTEGEVVIPIKMIHSKNIKDSISIFPQRVFLKYRAPLSMFSDISSTDFSIIAKLKDSDLSKNTNTLPLELVRIPPYTKIVSIQPEAIEYYIIKEEIK